MNPTECEGGTIPPFFEPVNRHRLDEPASGGSAEAVVVGARQALGGELS